MKKTLLILAFLLPFVSTFSSAATFSMTCPAPSNLAHSTAPNSVSFDWDDCGCGETEYQVYYVKNGSTSQTYATTNSDIAFANLESGSYEFYFYTVCGEAVSNIIMEDVIIL